MKKLGERKTAKEQMQAWLIRPVRPVKINQIISILKQCDCFG